MPSLITCSLNYQLSITPELRRHLRPFNTEEEINIYDIYELKQQQQDHKQQQKLQNLRKDRLQQQTIIRKQQLQQKRHRWVLSTNLITILKQIKLTNPTSDIQQQENKKTTSTTLSKTTTTTATHKLPTTTTI